ncbi:MAG TPA: helix-turn-helix domain-containing protein [Acidimicrobiales bacterium]
MAGNDNSAASEVSGRERTVEALVGAAVRLFGERGPNRVSLREVAAEAGVNYGLIHQYVGTKDDLLALAMRSISARTAERFAEDVDPAAAMARLVPDGPEASSYIRMLAWALLEGRDPGQLLGRSPALHELAASLHRARARQSSTDDDATDIDDRVQVAAAVSLALGWNLFGTFVRSAAGLDELTPAEAAARIREVATRIISGDA